MRKQFVMVIPSSLMEAMRREVARLAVAEFSTDADGATLVQVHQVRDPDSLTDDDKGLLGIVNGVRFLVSRPFILPPPPRDPRREQADHMARLRKFTGQDWRGRRG